MADVDEFDVLPYELNFEIIKRMKLPDLLQYCMTGRKHCYQLTHLHQQQLIYYWSIRLNLVYLPSNLTQFIIDSNRMLSNAVRVADELYNCDITSSAKPGLVYALISLYPNIDVTKCQMNYSLSNYIYYIINAYILDDDVTTASKYIKFIIESTSTNDDFSEGLIITINRALSLYYKRYAELSLSIQSIIFTWDDPLTVLCDQPVEFFSDALLFLFRQGKQPKINSVVENKYANYLILLTYHDMIRPLEEHIIPLHKRWINKTLITSSFNAVSQCIALSKSIEEFDELLIKLSRWNIMIPRKHNDVIEIALTAYNSPLAGPIVAKSFIDRYLNDFEKHTHIPFSALDSPKRIAWLVNATSLTKGQTIGWRRSLINFVEYPRTDTLENLLHIVFNMESFLSIEFNDRKLRGLPIPNIEQQVELIHVIISEITMPIFTKLLMTFMENKQNYGWISNRVLPLVLIITGSIPAQLINTKI